MTRTRLQGLRVVALLVFAASMPAAAYDVTGAWTWYANGFKAELYLSQSGTQLSGWIGVNGENLLSETVTGTVSGIEVRFLRSNRQLRQPQEYHGFVLRANNAEIEPRVRMTGPDAMAGTFSHYGQWGSAWYAVRTGPYREPPAIPTDNSAPPPGAVPSLRGDWTSAGRPTSITQDDDAHLVFTNEYGQRSKGRVVDTRTVVATEWEGGLRGVLVDGGRTIRWANGTAWSRIASPGVADPSSPTLPALGGSWTSAGRPTSIAQDPTGTLLFTNEYGQRSKGRFLDPGTVVATEWEGGLRGVLADGGRTIRWANGTSWSR